MWIAVPVRTPGPAAGPAAVLGESAPPRLVAEMMTVKEVAAALRVSTATVYALVNGGQLEHFRVLNAIRIPCDAVGALMKRKP